MRLFLASSLSCRLLIAALALFAGVPALAQSSTASAPTGQWELKVGGTFEGDKVNGIAYIEFEADGSLGGYYLSRYSSDVYQVDGSWVQVGKKFSGSVEVFLGSGETIGTFEMTGSARVGKSFSARLTDEFGSNVSLSGKPFVALGNLEGEYTGTIKQYGQTVDLYIELIPGEVDGLYEISGSFGGGSNLLSGFTVANRKGEFVAYVYNETDGIYSSIWGKISGGRLKATGISLEDGSKIQISLVSSGT